DPGHLEQVIMNLAVNARDAMPQGGQLTIRTTSAQLSGERARAHGAVPTGSYVLLGVSDTGCGMTDEVKRHVFEPFFTTKPEGTGTGLGLATVYGIIQQASGFIEVDSAPGQGTTSHIWLPAAEAADNPSPGAARAGFPPGTETVLLVEDEAPVRLLAREALALAGYRVLEAANGADAMPAYLDHANPGGPLDLVVTDVIMPGLGGRELSEFLRREHPQMKLLFMSGYTEDAVVRRGILTGAVPFLQ